MSLPELTAVLFKVLSPKTPIYIISHERSGTHFTINNLFRNTYVSQRLRYVGDWMGPYEDRSTQFLHIKEFVQEWPVLMKQGGLIKSHCDARLFQNHFPKSRVVYVLRDPRDTLVSFFHYLNRDELYHTNPGLATQRCENFSEFLRRPASDYLRLGFFEKPGFDNVCGRWAEHVSGWTSMPGVCVVRYEALKTDYRTVLGKICRANRIVPRLRVSPVNLKDGASVLPRKGIVGDWKNVFSREDEDFLAGEIARYGLKLDVQ